MCYTLCDIDASHSPLALTLLSSNECNSRHPFCPVLENSALLIQLLSTSLTYRHLSVSILSRRDYIML